MASKIVAYNGEKYALSYEIIAPDNSNLNAPEKTEKFTLADSEQITRSAGFRGGEPRAQRRAWLACEIKFEITAFYSLLSQIWIKSRNDKGKKEIRTKFFARRIREG